MVMSACSYNVNDGIDHQTKDEIFRLNERFFKLDDRYNPKQHMPAKVDESINIRKQPSLYFNCSDHLQKTLLLDKKIDVEFEEIDLRDALFEISILTDIPIVTDDSVEGIVSGDFNDFSIESVLATLLSVGEYDYRILDRYILIGSSEPSSSTYHQLSISCIYRPNYLDALSLVTMLPDFYRRYIKINKENGFIAITATNSLMNRIQRDITLFDVPQKQVVMELSIIEVSQEALEILGLDWQNIKRKVSAVYDQSLGAGSFGGRTVTLPTMKAKHFLDAVNALKRNGYAEIKSMPSIVVLEGKEAKFKSMQTVWSTEIMATSHKKEAIRYGIEMNVVPYVSELGHINLDIRNASVSDFIIDSYGLPKVIEHSLSSSVSIANGESLIIGGLLQKKQRQESSGIPFLDSIPFLGRLFSNKIKKQVESEILIILQPYVIKG